MKIFFIEVIVGLLCLMAPPEAKEWAGCAWAVLCCMRYRRRKEEEETKQMHAIVDSVIDMLRSHREACQKNDDLLPYMPLIHVRDLLLKSRDGKEMKKIWERAMNFISVNESRIRTEIHEIDGTDLLCWKWIESMPLMSWKVWLRKGQDLEHPPTYGLTPCLKIRNMFDPDVDVENAFDLVIYNTILQKCQDGIVHIGVDKKSQGCVYVKCLSTKHSLKAFKGLHGYLFDGKLVTVKYMPLERYHQRFPEARGCSTPL